MRQQNLVIIGSNAKAERLLASIIKLSNKGISILACCGEKDSEVAKRASNANIPMLELEDLLRLGERIDLIFDVSDDDTFSKELRRALFQSSNRHTVIAPASVAKLLFALFDIDDGAPSNAAVGF